MKLKLEVPVTLEIEIQDTSDIALIVEVALHRRDNIANCLLQSVAVGAEKVTIGKLRWSYTPPIGPASGVL